MLLFSMLLLKRGWSYPEMVRGFFKELKITTIFYIKIIFSEVKFKGTFIFKSFKPECFKVKSLIFKGSEFPLSELN